jgi:hypothetical protein
LARRRGPTRVAYASGHDSIADIVSETHQTYGGPLAVGEDIGAGGIAVYRADPLLAPRL